MALYWGDHAILQVAQLNELESARKYPYLALRLEPSDCEALICELSVQATHSSLMIELIEFGETGSSMMKHVKLNNEVEVHLVILMKR